MADLKESYKSYRWFFTSSGKLVIGGKSADQNEEIVNEIVNLSKKQKKDFVVMHTREPGSPFAIILSPKDELSREDIEETAIWCGCFSRAWREGKKKTVIDIFSSFQIKKAPLMKSGTFGVVGKSENKTIELKLFLTKQEKKLRAVPIVKNKKEILSVITPGKIEKNEFSELLAKKLKVPKEEVLNALPTGKFQEIK